MTEDHGPKRYERPPAIAYVLAALIIAGFVGWYFLTEVRTCVIRCNGECHTACEPSIRDRWLDR